MGTAQRLTALELRRFLPRAVLQRVLAGGGRPVAAEETSIDGTLLFADITGFSALTERLSRHADGAERIRLHLDNYLGRIIACVEGHGGDVIKFAGDALIAVWAAQGGDLAATARAACAAGLRAQKELATQVVEGDISLSMRILIDTGPLRLMQLGGALDRWETLLVGDAVCGLGAMKPLTPPGSVVVSAATGACLDRKFSHRNARRAMETLRLTAEVGSRNTAELADVAADQPLRLAWSDGLPTFSPARVPAVQDEMVPALRAWLSNALLSRLGQSSGDWAAELRQVTIVFAALPYPIDGSLGLDQAQAAVEAMQRAIYRYDGGIDKLSIDEKGAVLIGAFGLPPTSHEDNAARGSLAALAIQRALSELGLTASVGVASGRLFCGTVGSPSRGEYTCLGPAMNLAARLMEASHGRVLCDPATARAAGGAVGFAPKEPLRFRGISEPVQVFEPTGPSAKLVRGRSALVGRERERETMAAAIQAVLRVRRTVTVLLQGEAGIGKSRLMEELHAQTESQGVRVLRGSARSVDRLIAYHAWRPIFIELFGIEPTDTAAERGEKVDAILVDLDGDLRHLRPLIEPVLGADLGDDASARHLGGELRAQQTRRLLATLLQRVTDKTPLCVMIEDVHWADSASWALIRAVRQSVHPLLIVLATRPIDEPPPELAELLAVAAQLQGNTTHLRVTHLVAADVSPVHVVRVGPLRQAAALQLAAQVLGARALPEDLGELIWQRTGGNAFFVEELSHALLDTQVVAVRHGEVVPLVPLEELAATRLPASIDGLVVSRLDALELPAQMTLKVASVLGREFAVPTVQELLPVADAVADVPGLMPVLERKDFVRTGAEPLHYLFKHALTQEAIYNLMLFAQRRMLHRAAAMWYERAHAEDPSHILPVLAYHWERAEEWDQALRCLELAAETNLERYANREAVDLFDHALALAPKAATVAAPTQVARWHRRLAEGLFRIGDLGRAQHHGRLGLRGLGVRLPTSLLGTVASLLWQLGSRLGHRLLGPRLQVRDERRKEQRREMIAVLNRITEIHIYAENAVGCLDAGLRELNLASALGPSPELGRAYAVMAVVLGTVPQLRGLARGWGREAVAAVDSPKPFPVQAYVLVRVAIVDLYDARWAEALPKYERAHDIARATGDRRLREEALGVWGITLFFAGRFAESEPLIEAMVTSANISGNRQIQAWARLQIAAQALRTGQAEAARALLDEIEGWCLHEASNSEVLWHRGLSALAWYRLGQTARAEEILDGLAPLLKNRPVAYWLQNSLAALAETAVRLWMEEPPDSPRAAAMGQRAERACRQMMRFGKAFPFGRAQGLLWEGVRLSHQGARARAEATLRDCVVQAEQLALPWERLLALRELGRRLGADDPERARALDEAIAGLTKLQAHWDLLDAVRAKEGR